MLAAPTSAKVLAGASEERRTIDVVEDDTTPAVELGPIAVGAPTPGVVARAVPGVAEKVVPGVVAATPGDVWAPCRTIIVVDDATMPAAGAGTDAGVYGSPGAPAPWWVLAAAVPAAARPIHTAAPAMAAVLNAVRTAGLAW
ncbi:MAG: hypothetical protein JO191_04255 [Mycobacteriaceae bacterium]|nr:hypothetical protein [Mycobacteriaceae bacterium]MBV9514436.1 hypothetical protein [Mycobacteriaceae bacterium]